MFIAGKFDTGIDRPKGEAYALYSCRLERARTGHPLPGFGLLGIVNYKTRDGVPRGSALQVALREWNAYGMRLQIGPLRLLLALFWFGLASAQTAPAPLSNAHAHNDYLHPRPLLDALDHGFCSVEADIYLVDGQLLVAHDRDKVRPERTLQALYLDPLRERVKKNGGRVFPNGPEVTLLIDLKTEAEATYARLREVLQSYSDMLTQFRTNAVETKAVTVILSGNRPVATLAAEPLRLAAIDGRLPDLEANPSRYVVPLVSDNWTKHFQWRGMGPLPDQEKEKLGQLVALAHQQGRKLRLWATPDAPAAWGELRAAGVDLINTDNLAGLQKFLLSR